MNSLEILDVGNGEVRVSWYGETVRPCLQSVLLTDPLTAQDRKELSWYLEDYLQFPYGAQRERARKVVEKMAEWGESLFTQVFTKCDSDPDPRLLYHEAVRHGLDACELYITSDDPHFLGIPWELLRDPTPGRGYLAPLLGGFYRKHSDPKIEEMPEPGKQFRILFVVCRPLGEKDVPLQTVAGPVLEALRPFRDWIELDVLRPPTFDALQKCLNTNRGHYQCVHFDGHGILAKSPLMYGGSSGYLLFENEKGEEHAVSSEELGQALATCKVPLFVLNACQSAQEGGDPYSSVASRLVALGAQGVVAMSYSVHSTAASKFMERFYETLVENATLGEAVAAGRQKLYTDPLRGSVIGLLELRDWMVPCLYQQRMVVPIPEILEQGEARDEVYERARAVCEEGQFGFIGRDYDILKIERALVDNKRPWVLISGMGGVGKTALAYGFARWYAETGGCPGGVFVTSFRKKADLASVLGSIAGYGTDFSRLPEEKQIEIVVKYLRENPCLLVWDNVETVGGYPEGTDPLASDEERKELSQFLKQLKRGKTKVLITTRKSEESWLDIGYHFLELKGLSPTDRGILAKSILETAGRSPEDFKDDPEYSTLLKLLKGHPRSMEVVLPHLKDKTPGLIVDGLQHNIRGLADVLDASLTFVFPLLSEKTQKYLPFIGVFTGYVHEDLIGLFLEGSDCLGKMEKSPDKKEWKAILTEAAAAGLIRLLGSGIYELHPTFPLFLQQEFVSQRGVEALVGLDLAFMKFYEWWSNTYYEDLKKRNQNALRAVAIEEANLVRALHLAEMNEEWFVAHSLLRMLYEFYESSGRLGESGRLCDHMLKSIGYRLPDNADQDMVNLWTFVLSAKANHALQRNELEVAESSYEHIRTYLERRGSSSLDPRIGTCYHQLGIISQEKQQFDVAEEYYKRALGIFKKLRLRKYIADTYHSLGLILQKKEQFDLAKKWYKKALKVYERLGLERDAADTYHNLGTILQEKQRFEDAEEWYKKALEIRERLGLERDAADTYHNLGIILQEKQRFEDAEEWYKKALEIRERLGLERDVASSYHQLGRISQKRQQFDVSEDWYKKALGIFEKLKLERDAGYEYYQLGTIAQKLLHHEEAEKWYKKALEIFEKLKLENYIGASYQSLGRISQEKQQFDVAEKRYKKALEIYRKLRLERDLASVHYNLGLIAQRQLEVCKAEKLFKEALGIYKSIDYPNGIVNTLYVLGILYKQQDLFNESIESLGNALRIAMENQMHIVPQILVNLAQIMRQVGEENFRIAWRHTFGNQEALLESICDIMRRLEER